MEGAEAIARVLNSNIGITKLGLVETGLDCNSLKAICEGLQNSMSLEYLDLRHNIFDEEGLGVLIKSLTENCSIKHLYLESMSIGENEAKLLGEFMVQDDCRIEELELNEADIEIKSLDIIMDSIV